MYFFNYFYVISVRIFRELFCCFSFRINDLGIEKCSEFWIDFFVYFFEKIGGGMGSYYFFLVIRFWEGIFNFERFWVVRLAVFGFRVDIGDIDMLGD